MSGKMTNMSLKNIFLIIYFSKYLWIWKTLSR